jgi:hypothetical protein
MVIAEFRRFTWALVTDFIPMRLALRRRWSTRPRSARAALGTLDSPTLADIGFGPGTILSIARDVGVDRLRRPLHL